MALQLESLEKAIASLQEAIEFSCSKMAKEDNRLFRQFRNSVIQCFEFTYELSWKMLKRRLELDAPTPSNIDELNYNDLMREAAVRGLIQDPVLWMEYRKERNITSHAYNERMAQEVYEAAMKFFKDASELLKVLQEKNL